MFHPVHPDTIWCCSVGDGEPICIWLCYPVLWGANQYVSKMLAKQPPSKGAFEGQEGGLLGRIFICWGDWVALRRHVSPRVNF